ncbi:D-alanyl-D-alanine dipeptidase [Legionella gratiana]|uniref:D-alanyl-D-alanine dipeptidase n=1 Tax=Legionella gratiana TaxID=45066 RepID=A0A378JA04_9GAMM|nr:M15 family metallopeptidase [Legionella gratiana]KTD11044.1 D-alanyl-D-alanine dipeptidase [Legionella gratiana]STX44612.1 D-alanyl-D-alanine dipeptidase [Legionella gratiana]
MKFGAIKYVVISVLWGIMMPSNAVQNTFLLIADPKILAIPIIDNDETMIDLKDQREIAYGPSPEIPNNTDYTKLRKTVYEKLKQAQTLLPEGLRFRLYEGYRSLQLQKMLFDARYAKVKTQHPSWSHQQLFDETTKLVSPVINLDSSINIPPHSTGGAIDVYLVNDKEEEIDMGIHPKDWMTDLNGTLSLTNSNIISKKAKYYRHIMSEVLSRVGFVNYPTEYWHWSYGDRYWAYNQHQSHAIYSSYTEKLSLSTVQK